MIFTPEMIKNLTDLVNKFQTVSQRPNRELFLIDKKYIVCVKDMTWREYHEGRETVREGFLAHVQPTKFYQKKEYTGI